MRNKLKNLIKLAIPNATNIKTGKYGYTNFDVPTMKDGKFAIWDDENSDFRNYKLL